MTKEITVKGILVHARSRIDENSYASIMMQRSDRTFTYQKVKKVLKFYNEFNPPLGSLGVHAYIYIYISVSYPIHTLIIGNFKIFIILKMFYQTY